MGRERLRLLAAVLAALLLLEALRADRRRIARGVCGGELQVDSGMDGGLRGLLWLKRVSLCA